MKTIVRRKEIKYGVTRSKMADVLVVDKDVFRRFLRSIGIEHGYKLTPKEVEMIRNGWFGEKNIVEKQDHVCLGCK